VRHRRVVERADDVEERVESRSLARWSAGSSSVPMRPSDEGGGAGRSTYVTSAWTTFFGLKISASASSRGSGTLTTPTLSVTPP
jgi:hypothetical protein